MNVELFRDYCLSKKGVTESFPFDESTLVFKVMQKVFAICALHKIPFAVNLKCDPAYAVELREEYASIIGGFHMHKKHWNTVTPDASISDQFFLDLVDHSYDMVVKGMTKKMRQELESI